jgi:ferredoxin
MAVPWGLFLCSCRGSLPLNPERLRFPVAPSPYRRASSPEEDLEAFAAEVRRERPERVLVACCADPWSFSEALRGPKLEFLDLKGFCFAPHPDEARAHAKANRLLRATMDAAALDTAPLRPLRVGNRVLIVTDGEAGFELGERLEGLDRTLLLLAGSGAEAAACRWRSLRGRLLEVRGFLGAFTACVEAVQDGRTLRQEIEADQIAAVTSDEAPALRPRTGCHVLRRPSALALERLAAAIRDLTGDFLKPEHVAYDASTCAGGSANQQACGLCISACPYDAIDRDPENPLRVRVSHRACEGCGACVSACPTSSLSFTEPSPQTLYRRLASLLAPLPGDGTGNEAILFHCGERGRRALERAGREGLRYAASLLPVEVPCLRFVSDAAILGAFGLGAAGVALLGCAECPHGERRLLFDKLEFCRLVLDAFCPGRDLLRLVAVAPGEEPAALGELTAFAESLPPAAFRAATLPEPPRSREVIAGALGSFFEASGIEPGPKPLGPSQPFAFAEVRAAGCTMCRSCVNVCPTHAFRFDEERFALDFKHIACVACGLCEKVCPESVVQLRREIRLERRALEYQTIVQDAMVACTECGKPFVNQKALAAIEARVLSLPSLFETFAGSRRHLLRMCPDCRAVAAMLEVDKGWKP